MKIELDKPVHRLGIYFFYDQDGFVDDYVLVLLNDLVKNLDQLLIVSNGPLSPQGRIKFQSITQNILERENWGLDVWAYKEALATYGWESLSCFDEVILLNYTLMGPLYPFKVMFDSMTERDLDFWGITRHYGHSFDPYNKCKYGYIPMHISSSFMAFRTSIIQSTAFQKYWDEMPMIHDYAEAVCYHEAIFTKDFTQLGFKSDTYVDTDDLAEYHPYPQMMYALELVKNRKCPVFKRKLFYNQYEEFIESGCGQQADEFYTYLREHTSYNVNLIWDTLLRTANMSDIKERMQLNYVLPNKVILSQKSKHTKVALFIHIYYPDEATKILAYAQSMPITADVYITSDTEQKLSRLREIFADLEPRSLSFLLVTNRGRDVSALLIGLKTIAVDYDLICFVHDKKTQYIKPYMIGESFAYHCFENVLGSPELVENIVTTFVENPRLGLLMPPPPIHGNYANLPGGEWTINFRATQSLAQKLGITVPISENKSPIAPIGTIFWFRPVAFRTLFNYEFNYSDFPEEPNKTPDGTLMHIIERVYPFAAQQAGFYSGWVISEKIAQYQLTNLNKLVGDYNRVFVNKIGSDSRENYLHLIAVGNRPSLFDKSIESRKVCVKQLIKKIGGQKALNFASKIWKKLQKNRR